MPVSFFYDQNELFCQKIDILLDEPSINFRVVTLWSCHVLISAFSFVSEDLRRRENELDVFSLDLFTAVASVKWPKIA